MSSQEGFDRERFLLRTVAGVFIAQVTLYAIAMAACINLSLKQLPRPACSNFATPLKLRSVRRWPFLWQQPRRRPAPGSEQLRDGLPQSHGIGKDTPALPQSAGLPRI
jgi:hypothetical protein